MKFLSLIILLSISTNIYAISLDERREQIIEIIDEELDEISRLSREVRGKNPDYLLRMAELNLEKARLWREKENSEFLSIPAKKRSSVNKSSYFRKSTGYFNRANKLCIEITRRFPRFRSISDVYYILGYNAKESGKDNTAQKYFAKATRGKTSNKETTIKSKISLAEIYYNKKRYKQAIPLYESALRQYKDKWWTKDSFNLAWCYFRAKRYSNAISKMQEVFRVSTNKKYIDMRSQVERDIGYFFAIAGRIGEGIKFYKKIGINFTDQLLRIAVALKDEGKFSDAQKVLGYADKYEKRQSKKGEIYIEQLALYDEFGRELSHLKTTEKLYALYKKDLLSKNQIKTLVYQAKKRAAMLQKQVASKTYRRLKTKRNQKAQRAIRYFELLTVLEKKNALEYEYLKAETAYANRYYTQAIGFYERAFLKAKKDNDKKYVLNSLEGMLACLGQRSMSAKTKNIYYSRVYENYVATYPRNPKSKAIYPKLFNVYMEKKDYKGAGGVINKYAKVYPKDYKIQEAMIAPLMEVSRQKKDYKVIRKWIDDIDKGKYQVSNKYKRKLKELMTTIQIEGVQNALTKGQKKEALVGYHKILKDPYSTKRSKINAKYNLAALYYELGSTGEAYNWSIDAIAEMTSKDAVRFSDSFLTIAGFLFTKLEFKASADLSKRMVAKLCQQKSRRKAVAFKNTVFLYLSEGDIKSTEEMISLGRRCKIPASYVLDAEFELIDELKSRKKWTEYENKVSSLQSDKRAQGRLVYHFYVLEKVHTNFNNEAKKNFYFNLKWQAYKTATRYKQDIPLEGLDVISDDLLKEMLVEKKAVESISLRFPDNIFNNLLKGKLAKLEGLTAKAQQIQKIGSGRGIIGAYKVLFETYTDTADQIKNFVPAGKSKEFVDSFQKAMKSVYDPLYASALSYKREGWQTIEENQILSDFNFLLSPFKPLGSSVRYEYPSQSVIMDRGGKR